MRTRQDETLEAIWQAKGRVQRKTEGLSRKRVLEYFNRFVERYQPKLAGKVPKKPPKSAEI